MKKYEKPEICCILLKTEEQLAAPSKCACSGTSDYHYPNGTIAAAICG